MTTEYQPEYTDDDNPIGDDEQTTKYTVALESEPAEDDE